jgi:hypothetical protein
MRTKHRKVPAYRLHKPTGQAVVRLDGKDHYLGRHGTEASRESYRRTIAEWLTAGGLRPPASGVRAPAVSPTVDELILAFWSRHAEGHYRHADGTPTGELDNFRDSLRPLRRLYGGTPAADFGPKALKLVRQAMIEAGLARTTINQRVGRIVRVFKRADPPDGPPGVEGRRRAAAGPHGGPRAGARQAGA